MKTAKVPPFVLSQVARDYSGSPSKSKSRDDHSQRRNKYIGGHTPLENSEYLSRDEGNWLEAKGPVSTNSAQVDRGFGMHNLQTVF